MARMLSSGDVSASPLVTARHVLPVRCLVDVGVVYIATPAPTMAVVIGAAELGHDTN